MIRAHQRTNAGGGLFGRALCLPVLTAILCLGAGGEGQCGTTVKDVLISVRTLGFLKNPPEGLSDFAVIYDPANPDSTRDKTAVYDAIDGGTPIGPAIIRTAPIPVTELHRIKNYRYILITSGIDSYIPKIRQMIQGSGIVTITTNLNYVASGDCVLGVSSDPKVQVLLNRNAASDAAVSFSTSFRMMIQEM